MKIILTRHRGKRCGNLPRAKRFIEKLVSVPTDETVLFVGHDSINRRLVWAITGEECSEGMKNVPYPYSKYLRRAKLPSRNSIA